MLDPGHVARGEQFMRCAVAWVVYDVLSRTYAELLFLVYLFVFLGSRLSHSLQRYSARAIWKAVECRGRRLFDIWQDYVRGRSARTPRRLRFESSNTRRTIVVLACKYAKIVGHSTEKSQRLDPDILRLDTLHEQVWSEVRGTT